MKNKNLKSFKVQTHIHGSGGHGIGSHLGYDYIALREGIIDVVWWMEHEFRLANFGKMPGFTFGNFEETFQSPNRDLNSNDDFTDIRLWWDKIEGDNGAGSEIVSGHGALENCMRLTQSGPGNCIYELKSDNHREKFPVFTYPVFRLAVMPERICENAGEAFFRIVLSQQPPEFKRSSLTYSLNRDKKEGFEMRGGDAFISIPWQEGKWNELILDIGKDVERYEVPGGLDNTVCNIQIGIANTAARTVSAFFANLAVKPRLRGNAGLEKERELVASLPLRLTHHVGMEVSYYGQHINCFGSSVPVPDYEKLPGKLTSKQVVSHIHKHGGLASINHLHPEDMEAAIENDFFGADLLEINKKKGGVVKKLQFWDKLPEHGLTVTAVTGTDCHDISPERIKNTQLDPSDWINCFWAQSDSEKSLLECLKHGRLYLTAPAFFTGHIQLQGPEGTMMGDVMYATEEQELQLEAEVSGTEEDDILIWLLNGYPFSCSEIEPGHFRKQITLPFQSDENLKAVRIQIVRPKLVDSFCGGIIAFTNPIYVISKEITTAHRTRNL